MSPHDLYWENKIGKRKWSLAMAMNQLITLLNVTNFNVMVLEVIYEVFHILNGGFEIK